MAAIKGAGMFYSQERIGLFIDGANLYSAARGLGFDIDYKKLLQEFANRGRLIRAFYYTAIIEDQEYSPLRPLVDWLDYNGYTLVTKRTKEYYDESGRRRIKGNMDIELAIDMLEMTPHLDHVVLFSGDGDFRRLVEAVQRKGVRASVVSTIRSQPPMVADELRRQADQFIELQELAPKIMRDPALREAAMQQRMARQAEAPQSGDDEVDTTPVLPSRYTSAPRPSQPPAGGDGSQRPAVPPNFRRGGA